MFELLCYAGNLILKSVLPICIDQIQMVLLQVSLFLCLMLSHCDIFSCCEEQIIWPQPHWAAAINSDAGDRKTSFFDYINGNIYSYVSASCDSFIVWFSVAQTVVVGRWTLSNWVGTRNCTQMSVDRAVVYMERNLEVTFGLLLAQILTTFSLQIS